MNTAEVKHFHLFCGLGGGAMGFNQAEAALGNTRAKFRCIGGIDSNPAAIRDFNKLANAQGTVLDLFDREQYISFHGKEPDASWREATLEDIRKAAGNEDPNIVFLSAPCKGFSGLLSETRSKTDKYQALNRLTLRGVFLMLEAFKHNPPELVLFENVPRIATRGRHLLDQIVGMLRGYGYAVAETVHDCGQIGGLGQSRKRFLLVARHMEKVKPFLYQPVKKPLKSVGEVLSLLPPPGSGLGGPMHRIPSLQWKTWVRIAFVEAGGDWRSLRRLNVVDGFLKDYLLVPEYRSDYLGVRKWEEHTGTVAGRSTPSNGAFSVADPRIEGVHHTVNGVKEWNKPMGTVTSRSSPSTGAFAVADPRFTGKGEYSQYGVVGWGGTASTVTSQRSPGQGKFAVADPRIDGVRHNNVFRVVKWDVTAPTVTGGGGPTAGGLVIADPRTVWNEKRKNFEGAGHYGVIPWEAATGAVSAAAGHDNGRWSVADPRFPKADEKLIAQIISEDNTWHRPFTTLELASLQGLVDPEKDFQLSGISDTDWRERIGNAVPASAAKAIASEMGKTLLAAWAGENIALSETPIWVRPIAVALSMSH